MSSTYYKSSKIDLIKLNKDGLHHGHFAVYNVSRSEQTAVILSTDQSLSSTSGAFFYFLL